jgi:hypothetical protein
MTPARMRQSTGHLNSGVEVLHGNEKNDKHLDQGKGSKPRLWHTADLNRPETLTIIITLNDH